MSEKATSKATIGAGCFWGVEYIFERIAGVLNAVSGYSGGEVENPTYQEVCTGTTGHAEVVQLEFDPGVISFKEILDYYFRSHDPTQLNGQGPDLGHQYRSVVFYHNEGQKKEVEDFIQKLNDGEYFDAPVVTEVKELKKFYPAEEYHQDYYSKNNQRPYCHVLRESFKL